MKYKFLFNLATLSASIVYGMSEDISSSISEQHPQCEILDTHLESVMMTMIPEEDKKIVEKISSAFNDPKYRKIIGIVEKISLNESIDIIFHAVPFIHMDMDEVDFLLVLNAVTHIPTDQRSNVIHNALQLLSQDMDGSNCRNVIHALASIPMEQREAFLNQVRPFISENLSGWCRTQVIKTVANLANYERKNVLIYALKLISETMDGADRCHIIYAVSRQSPDERQNIVYHALQLIPEEMDGWDRARIIQSLGRLSAVNRPAFVEFCQNHDLSLHELRQVSSVNIPNHWQEILTMLRDHERLQNVFLDNQTVHNTSVEDTIQLSVKNLENRYGKKTLLSLNVLKALYLNKIKSLQHKLHPGEVKVLKTFFNDVTDTSDALTNYLSLVWYALTDRTVIQDKDEAFLGWFRSGPIDAQLAYLLDNLGETYKNQEALLNAIEEGHDQLLTSGTSCPAGTLNRLIDGLNLIHPDVNIQAGEGQIKNVQIMRLRNFLEKASIAWLADQYKLNPKLFEEKSSKILFDEGTIKLDDRLSKENKQDFNRLSKEDIKACFHVVLNELNLDADADKLLTAEEIKKVLTQFH